MIRISSEEQAVLDALGLDCQRCGAGVEMLCPHELALSSKACTGKYAKLAKAPHSLDLFKCINCYHVYYRYDLEQS